MRKFQLCFKKTLIFRVFLSLLVILSLHLAGLATSYVTLSSQHHLSGAPSFDNEFFSLDVQGGFPQHYQPASLHTPAHLLLRGKALNWSIHLKAKQDLDLQLTFTNLHPHYSFVEHPSWKAHPHKKAGQCRLLLKAGELYDLEVRCSLPQKTLKFLLGSDLEEGYYSLLHFYAKALKEEPLFIFFLGDVVDKGEWFRYELHYAFFESLPFPVFSILGDGDLDDFSEKSDYIEERMSLFQRYYGEPESCMNVGEWSLLGMENLKLSHRTLQRFQKKITQHPLKSQRILLAHLPPLDPRDLAVHEKKAILRQELFREFLQHYHLPLGFYGELHEFYQLPYLQEHQMNVSSGLGGRLFQGNTYSYFSVELEETRIQVQPRFFSVSPLFKKINKLGYYWWGWWFLGTRSWLCCFFNLFLLFIFFSFNLIGLRFKVPSRKNRFFVFF